MPKKRLPSKVREYFDQSKMPPEVLEFFRKEGAKGGKIGGSVGGKTAAANMTPEQRSDRARRAAAAREAKKRNAENG